MYAKGDELIELLKISYQEQKRFITTLTDEERGAKGEADNWSPKDVLAHVAFCDEVVATDVADPARTGVADDEYEAIEEENSQAWLRYEDASWQQVEALIDKAHEDLVISIGNLSADQLNDPNRYRWTRGRPPWQTITNDSYYHPLVHLSELYAKRGDVDYANQLQEEAVARQLALDNSKEWQGTVLYNLGCYFAGAGQKEKALQNVGQGLAFNPNLKGWASQDPDLKSLSLEPRFKAMLS